jgi:8-oxo-dGTP pyrophosphatase MutT (NUDIX family)
MLASLKRRAFWMISRSAIFFYGHFPIFGKLRASIAIVRQGELFLAIERNDGLGLSLPGGLAHYREPEELVMSRELFEETGLRVKAKSLLISYESNHPYRAAVTAFAVETEGEIRGSWEGTPRWVTLNELRHRLVGSREPILDRLAQL